MRSTCFLAIFSLFEGKKIFTRQGVEDFALEIREKIIFAPYVALLVIFIKFVVTY